MIILIQFIWFDIKLIEANWEINEFNIKKL